MHLVDEFTCRDTVYFEVIEPDPIVAEFELTLSIKDYTNI